MKKYEFTLKNSLGGHFRVIPAFMSDGARVLYKNPFHFGRDADKENLYFSGSVFESEEAADAAVAELLGKWLKIGYVTQYTVAEK